MHDSNFSRTAGVDKNVWEVDYAEVESYDVGSWFSDEYTKEPVPTLDGFLERAKDRMEVMIELKYTGHEKNLVQGVIDVIEKHEMVDQTQIGSMNSELLKEVKTINSRIKTVYITPLMVSSDFAIDFVDGVSVETTVLSREMVMMAEYRGKEVYGWTANSEETIEKLLRSQVTGIVTDNPELVKHYADQTWEHLLLQSLIRIFFGKNAAS